MSQRPVTLFTGQWADLKIADLLPKVKAMGYEGVELACWGDHFDVVRAVNEKGYVESVWELLKKHDLGCWAISAHLVGQATCDNIDERHQCILPAHVWGDGNPEGVRQRACAEMALTAQAARKFFDAGKAYMADKPKGSGKTVVNGFTGSSIWHAIYAFPPTNQAYLQKGYDDFAKRWKPILEVFEKNDVYFGLEVHPTEIAFDIASAQRALDAVGNHKRFGFNYDPATSATRASTTSSSSAPSASRSTTPT
jgi:sugar phosphate isomerase/epimerase